MADDTAAVEVVPPRPETRGFRRELTPTWLATAILLNGHRPPDFARPFRAAYLGCGDGTTPAVVAAVHPEAEVWAWDTRPEPVEATRRLREAAGLANLVVHERPGLPEHLGGGVADLIVVRGVFDRASDELRDQIFGAIHTSLRPGGVLCVTYKTTVGWIEIVPIARIMRGMMRRRGGDAEAVSGMLDALKELRNGGARHLTERPYVIAWLEELFAMPSVGVPRLVGESPCLPVLGRAGEDLEAQTGQHTHTHRRATSPGIAGATPGTTSTRAPCPSPARRWPCVTIVIPARVAVKPNFFHSSRNGAARSWVCATPCGFLEARRPRCASGRSWLVQPWPWCAG